VWHDSSICIHDSSISIHSYICWIWHDSFVKSSMTQRDNVWHSVTWLIHVCSFLYVLSVVWLIRWVLYDTAWQRIQCDMTHPYVFIPICSECDMTHSLSPLWHSVTMYDTVWHDSSMCINSYIWWMGHDSSICIHSYVLWMWYDSFVESSMTLRDKILRMIQCDMTHPCVLIPICGECGVTVSLSPL